MATLNHTATPREWARICVRNGSIPPQYDHRLLDMNTPFDKGFPVPFVYHGAARCEGDGKLLGGDSGKPRSTACKDHVLKHEAKGLA